MLALPAQVLNWCVVTWLELEDALLLTCVNRLARSKVEIRPLALDCARVRVDSSQASSISTGLSLSLASKSVSLSQLHTLVIQADEAGLALLQRCPKLRHLSLSLDVDLPKTFEPRVLRSLGLESCKLRRSRSLGGRELLRNLPTSLKRLCFFQFQACFDELPLLPELEWLDVDSDSVCKANKPGLIEFVAAKCPRLVRLLVPTPCYLPESSACLRELALETAKSDLFSRPGVRRLECLSVAALEGHAHVEAQDFSPDLQVLELGRDGDHLSFDFSRLPRGLKVLKLQGFCAKDVSLPCTNLHTLWFTICCRVPCLDLRALRALRVLCVQNLSVVPLLLPEGVRELELGPVVVSADVFTRMSLPKSLESLDIRFWIGDDAGVMGEDLELDLPCLQTLTLCNETSGLWVKDRQVWWSWLLRALGIHKGQVRTLTVRSNEPPKTIRPALAGLEDLTLALTYHDVCWHLLCHWLEEEALRLRHLVLTGGCSLAVTQACGLLRARPNLLERLTECRVRDVRLKPRHSVSIPVTVYV
jgi:hypothetical protein